MEDVARDDNELRRSVDRYVDGSRERLRNVCLALVEAGWGRSLKLPKPEVQVG
jgi:hypothetical protein